MSRAYTTPIEAILSLNDECISKMDLRDAVFHLGVAQSVVKKLQDDVDRYQFMEETMNEGNWTETERYAMLEAENTELKEKYKGLRSTKEIRQILTDWMREGVAKNRVFALQKAFEFSKQSEINLD